MNSQLLTGPKPVSFKAFALTHTQQSYQDIFVQR